MNATACSLTVTVLAAVALSTGARTQCSTSFFTTVPHATLLGNPAHSITWDPDGGGPAPALLVVGGSGLIGGSVQAPQRVMVFDGSEWRSLGNGPVGSSVTRLTVWNDQLVACGNFINPSLNSVAVWNGTFWQPILGLGFVPETMTQWNGNLVAARGTTIRVWDGVQWSTLPAPPFLSAVEENAMVSFQGLLCVAGPGPTTPSGVLARWNGTSWLTAISANSRINALAVRSFQFNSSLYVGGAFTSIGGFAATRIASTSGGTSFPWNQVGTGLPDICLELHVRATSALGVAVVAHTSSPGHSNYQLSGTTFVSMGGLQRRSLSYYAAGYHGLAPSTSTIPSVCWRYDGSIWRAVNGQGITGGVSALTPSGADMIVGGIQSTQGPLLNGIARWDGTTLHPLGTGIGGGGVGVLATMANGDIVAGGFFASAGGTSATNIARWDGTNWSALGTGCNDQVLALCRMPNGDVVAGGRFTTAGGVPCGRIARWNGTAWSALGTGMNDAVRALAVKSDGTLIAGGSFTVAGGLLANRVAQWNGTAWSAVGIGFNGTVHAMAARPNDDIVAVGEFTTADLLPVDRCALWNGSTWNTMGAQSGDTTIPVAVCVLPNGDVVAGRGFHQPVGSPDSGISRWDGSTWSGVGPGLGTGTFGSVSVQALVQRADGALFVGGSLDIVGGPPSSGLVRLSTTCPATASPYGAGCSSAAGPLMMTAETLPWIGASLRTATTGFPSGSLGLGLTGFSQVTIPLPSILPQGQPGCSQLASAEFVTLVLPDAAGTARWALSLPNIAPLIGISFFQQTAALELSGTGALVAVRSSNGLQLTPGSM